MNTIENISKLVNRDSVIHTGMGKISSVAH